jgi:hypothetical protein
MIRRDRLMLATTTPVEFGERLRVHLAAEGEIVSCSGHVADCRPASVNGSLGYGLEFAPDTGTTLPALPPDGEIFCVIRREMAVGVVNLGLGGCLVETNARLEAGASGQLVEARGDVPQAEGDAIRVVRCGSSPGRDGLWRAGIEFVWTGYPAPGAMRHVAVLLDSPIAESSPF